MGFACVDIGGTNTLVGVGNGEFELVEKVSSEEFLSSIQEKVGEAASRADEEIDRVYVAVAGPLDREKGTFRPPNIDREEVQIKQPLQQFGEVKIVNDTAAAVAGEYLYGDTPEDMVYITISSGIGMGAVIDGELIEGWNGNLGEIGHVSIGDMGLECGCGGTDHWEAYCSGNNLPEMARELTGTSFSDARQVFEDYREGDPDAAKAIEEMNSLNLEGLSIVVDLFNPELVSLGGAVALNHPDTIIPPLRENIDEKTINQAPRIELCSLGERSVLHGLRAFANGFNQDR